MMTMVMALLASSHTVNSRVFRFLVVFLFSAAILDSNYCFLHPVRGCYVRADDASGFQNVQASGGGTIDGGLRFDRGNSAVDPLRSSPLARLRIRGAKPAASYSLKEGDSFPPLGKTKSELAVPGTGAAEAVASSSVGKKWKGGQKESKYDDTSSIPGLLWPEKREAEDNQASLSSTNKFAGRPCHSSRESSSPLASTSENAKSTPWFEINSAGDAEDAFLRAALVADTSYPLVRWPWLVDKIKQLASLLPSSQFFPFILPKVNGRGRFVLEETYGTDRAPQLGIVEREDKSFEAIPKQQQQQQRLDSAITSISNAQDGKRRCEPPVSPDHASKQQRSSVQHVKAPQLHLNAEAVRQISSREALLSMCARKLLAGSSATSSSCPHADANVDRYLLIRQRTVLKLSALSRLRRRWLVSDFEDDNAHRRALLADISPPGMWPDDDDDGSSQMELLDNSGS